MAPRPKKQEHEAIKFSLQAQRASRASSQRPDSSYVDWPIHISAALRDKAPISPLLHIVFGLEHSALALWTPGMMLGLNILLTPVLMNSNLILFTFIDFLIKTSFFVAGLKGGGMG